MRDKSYFNIFLSGFMVTLVVPVLTILLLYLQAEHIVKEQILLSNNNTLRQFFRLIDKEAEEMKNLVIGMGNNEKCMTYAKYAVYSPSRTGYQAVSVRKELVDYNIEKYKDLFVYYPYEGRIVSGPNSALSTNNYWKTYFEDYEYSEFAKVLECESLQPTLYSISNDENQSLLCVAMRKHNNRDVNQDYVVVVIMQPTYLEHIMPIEKNDDYGSVLIFNEKKELLISKDDTTEYNLQLHNGESTPYEAYFNGKKYMMQVQRAESIDGYYAYAMLYDYFWQKLFYLRIICGAGGLICIAVSILIAYRNTRRAYIPVGEMVTKLQKQANVEYNKKEKSEFEFFESILEKENQKIVVLNKEVKKSKDIRAQYFMRAILEGNMPGHSQAKDVFLENGISLCSDRFCVVAMNVKCGLDIAADLQRFIIGNVLEELYGKHGHGYVVRMEGERFAIVVNSEEGMDEGKVAEIFQEGQSFLKKNYQMSLTAGIGNIYEGMRDIHRSYKEALFALRYEYVFGEEAIIHYNSIYKREFCYVSGMDSKLFRMVMKYIKEGSEKSAKEFVAEILELHGIYKGASMDTIDCFKYEIMSVMYKAILCCDGVESKRGLIQELMEQPTLTKFVEQFAALLYDLYSREQGSTEKDDLCRKVWVYVEKHYSNPELSVTMIGQSINLTPSYLSKLFKEKYDISILDFIAQTRIKQAKVLLQDTSLSIKKISEEVGFLSDNVFIKTFRKWEGITPKVYRDLMFKP